MRDEKIQVHRKQGLHIRLAAALISTLQQHVSSSEELRSIWIEYNGRRAQIANLLAIVSLKIPTGGEFRLFTDQEEASPLIDVIQDFFSGREEEEDLETDQLLMESSVSMEAAMASMRHGVLVVNKENRITYVNSAAEELIGKTAAQLHFTKASETVPGSKIHQVLAAGTAEWNVRQEIGKNTIITNRSPIFYDGQIIGAVATFEDISSIESTSKELESVKLLQERLQLLIATIHDAIAFFDESGKLLVENRSFTLWTRQERKQPSALLKKAEWDQLKKNITLKKTYEGREGDFYVMKAHPVFLEGMFKGAVVSFIAEREMKDLMRELPEVTVMPDRREGDAAFQELRGRSAVLQETIVMAQKAAATDSTIFINGESGTGKELLAQGIHQASPRRMKPFVAINCASIPTNLLESELFGHERGSFTNAHRTHIGAFEQADCGTLFLDEISELAPEVQSKLLRVLQQREVVRVGGKDRIPINIRILSATNQPVEKLLQSGKFREDLFYRLYVVPLFLPPLRERKEDIPELAETYLRYFSALFQRPLQHISEEFLAGIQNRKWPGNIRELKNVMERVIALNETGYITAQDLPEELIREEKTMPKTLQEVEKEAIRQAAPYYASYNQLGKALGVTHKTIARKLKEYELEHLLGQKEQIHRAK